MCNIHADTPIPAGGQGEIHLGADGLPSGLLIGQAYNLALSVIPKYTVEEYKGAFRKGIAAANAKGVCSIGDGSIGYMGNQWQLLRAFHELEKEGDLNLRFYLVIMDYGYIPFMEGGLVTGFGSESPQLGSIKLLLDGSIQGRTASVKEPYLGTDEKGLLHHTPEDLQARVERYHRGGCQIAIHTNGDNAIEEAINAIEGAGGLSPPGRPAHAHPLPDGVRGTAHRMAKLGIIANFFVGHVHVWGDLHRDRFIGERALRMDPVASAEKRNMPFCLHTDLPVTPLDPILSMYAVTARRTKSGKILGEDQRVSVYDALRAWTVNAAHSMFGETVKGSIREGYLADLVILSQNPLETAPDDLLDVQVVQTVVGGKTVYRA
ncbi:MAG: amidohydrolase [Bilophila wadsworthia]